MTELDFYFDIYSPYAYLGFHRLQKTREAFDCTVNYWPVDLPRLKREAGNTGPPNVSIPPKIKYLMTDLKRWADRYDLPFGEIPKGKDYQRINSGVFHAIAAAQADEYIARAYECVWGRGADANDNQELKAIAEAMGWDVGVFMDYIASEQAATAFEQSNQRAVQLGVFGVPTVCIGEHMWWGNDRMDFLDEYLGEQQ